MIVEALQIIKGTGGISAPAQTSIFRSYIFIKQAKKSLLAVTSL
jgi:hypothetical protein